MNSLCEPVAHLRKARAVADGEYVRSRFPLTRLGLRPRHPCNLDLRPLGAHQERNGSQARNTNDLEDRGRAWASCPEFPSPNSRLGQVPAGNQARLAQGWARRVPQQILVPKPFSVFQFKTVALPAGERSAGRAAAG